VGVLLSTLPEGRGVQALSALGKHSYSIYLWHMFIVVWGFPLIEGTLDTELSQERRLALYLAGSFVVGVAMARGVEVPMLRLRDRLFPSRGPSAVRVS
jgi:peptidoglycan/LPS O-acetylase OafA/YrhL